VKGEGFFLSTSVNEGRGHTTTSWWPNFLGVHVTRRKKSFLGGNSWVQPQSTVLYGSTHTIFVLNLSLHNEPGFGTHLLWFHRRYPSWIRFTMGGMHSAGAGGDHGFDLTHGGSQHQQHKMVHLLCSIHLHTNKIWGLVPPVPRDSWQPRPKIAHCALLVMVMFIHSNSSILYIYYF
jgi:hypothetical protein